MPSHKKTSNRSQQRTLSPKNQQHKNQLKHPLPPKNQKLQKPNKLKRRSQSKSNSSHLSSLPKRQSLQCLT